MLKEKKRCEDKLYAKAIEPYISGTAKTCSYCDHIEPLILQEGTHTYITMAIGQIVEGYTQICTQEHRTSAAGLYDFEIRELIKMKQVVRASYEEIYGCRGIAFEHGRAGSSLCIANSEQNRQNLCYHTHIHFVPVRVDIRYLIEEYTSQCFIIKNSWELRTFRRKVLQEESYLYFEDENEIGYVYPVNDERSIPRQFLRTCVAKELGLSERADWITYPGIEYFEEGRRKLQPVISKHFKAAFK